MTNKKALYKTNIMKTRIVILAAGRGTRMNSEVPKVLVPLNGKSIIQRLLNAVEISGVDERPVVVVGHGDDFVRRALGDKYEYVYQENQLGTGHAVQCAEKFITGQADAIIVLYGDHPFVQPTTIIKLRELHEEAGCVLSMMTTIVEDFEEWRASFADFGRVARDDSGDIASIIELKDATPAERLIKEVNPAFFCFNANWLWANLRKIDCENAKREYYLTDLVRIAIKQGERIASMSINPFESMGINTPKHLEAAKTLLSNLKE